MIVEEIRGDAENFPAGLRVLAVDDDPTCLKLLETVLRKCMYNVTTTSQARMALKMLRDNKDRFDLVISDVHMPDMDGFRLLELVGLEMDLPVIMLSGNSDPKLVMKGVTHGACDYLVKPIRIEELRNIWQHVIRRKKVDFKNQKGTSDQVSGNGASGEDLGSPLAGDNGQNAKSNRKRKDDDDDESEDNGNESEDVGAQKKPRVVWSIELHRKFVAAVNQLGIEKAVPKRILDMMNVEHLTRENVASHLQKYRLYLKRISTVASQQANMAAVLGAKDASFMYMGSLDGFGDFRTLTGPRLSNVALSPYTTGSMLGRINICRNVNLHNLAPSTLVQPGNSQNLSNSIDSLGKMHLVLPNSSQGPSLFQGIQSSLELDQLQQNKGRASFNAINNSRMFRSASTFADTPGSGSNNLVSNPLMLHGNAQQALSGGGFVNQSAHVMASFTSEPFNARVSGWQNTVESSKMHPTPLVSSADPIHSQLNGPYLQSNPVGPSSMALPPFEDSVDHVSGQDWVEQQKQPDYAKIPADGIMSNSGQTLDHSASLDYLASALMQHNEDTTESRSRPNEDFLFEQSKLQGGYDSLDYLGHDETATNGDFGFVEGYSFGPGI